MIPIVPSVEVGLEKLERELSVVENLDLPSQERERVKLEVLLHELKNLDFRNIPQELKRKALDAYLRGDKNNLVLHFLGSLIYDKIGFEDALHAYKKLFEELPGSVKERNREEFELLYEQIKSLINPLPFPWLSEDLDYLLYRMGELYTSLAEPLESVVEGVLREVKENGKPLKEALDEVKKEVGVDALPYVERRVKEELRRERRERILGIAAIGVLVAGIVGGAMAYKYKNSGKPSKTEKPPLTEKPQKTEKDVFLDWASSNGYNATIASELFDKSKLLQTLFYNGDNATLKNILEVASLNGSSVPKNLAFVVLDQIEKDGRVTNKASLATKVFSNLKEMGVYNLKRIDSVWLLNNATAYGFKSLDGLARALNFSETTNVSLNYNDTLCHSALADVGHYFASIFKYPYETYYLALQVGDVIYYYKIDKIKGKDYVWNGLIIPYVKWRFKKLESGEFESIGHKLTKGELKKLANWADPIVVQAAARSLYPFDELMDHDLLGFSNKERLFHNKHFAAALERGVNNVNYNKTIGASPYRYIYSLMMNDIKTKNARYQQAVISFKTDYPNDAWPNSAKLWKSVAEKYVKENPEIILIKGYPIALKIVDPPVNSDFTLSGQATPYYSKIIGAMLNKCVIVYTGPYPYNLHPTPRLHDEPFVVGDDGKLIGFWYELKAFLDDYNPEKNPNMKKYIPATPWIEVMLVSDFDLRSEKFEKSELYKVLNP